MMTKTAPMTADDYHSDYTRDSNSSLRLFRESIARYAAIRVQRTIDRPPPTPEMEFGTRFHAALLEPDHFRDTYLRAPDGDRRTTAVRNARAEFFASLKPGQLAIDGADLELISDMRDAVMTNPAARQAIEIGGNVEKVIAWEDDRTGAPLKMKADKITASGLIIDLKTTGKDCTPDFLQRTIYNFGYYTQADLYTRGIETAWQETMAFAFLFVSKEPPHESALVVIDHQFLTLGNTENNHTLAELTDRRARGDWTSRTHDTVLTIGPPRYALTNAAR